MVLVRFFVTKNVKLAADFASAVVICMFNFFEFQKSHCNLLSNGLIRKFNCSQARLKIVCRIMVQYVLYQGHPEFLYLREAFSLHKRRQKASLKKNSHLKKASLKKIASFNDFEAR